jgi:hypothetical protein
MFNDELLLLEEYQKNFPLTSDILKISKIYRINNKKKFPSWSGEVYLPS